MLRATAVVRKPAVKADRVVDAVTLDHEGRHRRRVALTGEKGLAFLLDLDKATVLNDGDALRLEDGSLVRVQAAAQRLIEIRAATPKRLMRIAWHIGNRHTPAEIGEDALWIEDDHVLVEMVRGLGAEATAVERPFQPERGAYEAAAAAHAHAHGSHAHDHHEHEGHGHDHGAAAHAHAHAESHASASAHAHAHDHGPGCGCGHDHAHDHAHDHSHRHAHDGGPARKPPRG
ncbi:urease accessory protein UreE [Alsobacter sp. SYSU BS001988]